MYRVAGPISEESRARADEARQQHAETKWRRAEATEAAADAAEAGGSGDDGSGRSGRAGGRGRGDDGSGRAAFAQELAQAGHRPSEHRPAAHGTVPRELVRQGSHRRRGEPGTSRGAGSGDDSTPLRRAAAQGDGRRGGSEGSRASARRAGDKTRGDVRRGGEGRKSMEALVSRAMAAQVG